MKRQGQRCAIAFVVATFTCASWPDLAVAHSGGLNAEGCHNDRKNGGFHCHRAQSPSGPPRSPASSSRPLGFVSGASRGAYANCAKARAAGAAPVRRGDPGYGPHLDRDNDGVGCEPYRGR